MQTYPPQAADGTEHFSFEVPMLSFSKANAPAGQERRVAGIISTERPDQEQEVILQRGLDFQDFLKNGWLNDNHGKSFQDVLGYGDNVQKFDAGQTLPDGSVAPSNCTWVEGYLLNTPKANDMWQLAQALQPTGRRLGYSVEGQILKRQGAGGKTIAKARVRHVALTHVPVNTDARLEILARSLSAIEKTLSVGDSAQVPLDAPTTGDGAGRILGQADLEDDVHTTTSRPQRRKARKSLTDREAQAYLQGRLGGCDPQLARHYLAVHKALVRSGRV